ncbi:hypothetical protein ALC62_03768, partial [Cyphomyrmex costatus]
ISKYIISRFECAYAFYIPSYSLKSSDLIVIESDAVNVSPSLSFCLIRLSVAFMI